MFTIAGIVRDAFGQPVENAIVTVHQRSDGGILGLLTTESDGKFIFNGDIPTDEEVYVTVTQPGRATQTFDQVDPVTFVQLTTDNLFTVNVCDPVGTVGPAVVNGDINGHPFTWEQISGLPVTLNDTNTLSPTYDNTPFDTRVFRLTIDPGTCLEQVADYTVSDKIQSNDSAARVNTAGTHYNQPQTAAPAAKAKDSTNFRLVPRGWTPGADDYVTSSDCPVTQFWILWDPPTDQSQLVRYDIQQFIAGDWQTISTIPGGGFTVMDAVNGETYRICTVHANTPLTQRAQYSKPFVGKTLDGIAYGQSIDQQINTALGRVSNFVVSIPTRIVKEPESTHDRFNTALGQIANFKEFVLTNKGLDGSVNSTDELGRLNTAGTRSFSIVRNNGISIGS